MKIAVRDAADAKLKELLATGFAFRLMRR